MSVTTASSCHGILGFKSALSKPEYSSSWVFILEPRDVLVISALSSCLVIVVSRVVLSPLLQTNKERKRTPRTPCGLFFSGRHLAGTIPWLIQKTPGPATSSTPSTALSTKGPPVGLSNPMRCRVARKVVRTIKSESISTWAFIASSRNLFVSDSIPTDGRSTQTYNYG
jgi:hypothetical protein